MSSTTSRVNVQNTVCGLFDGPMQTRVDSLESHARGVPSRANSKVLSVAAKLLARAYGGRRRKSLESDDGENESKSLAEHLYAALANIRETIKDDALNDAQKVKAIERILVLYLDSEDSPLSNATESHFEVRTAADLRRVTDSLFDGPFVR